MDISILGELEINDGTALLDVGGRRERAIVETLALAAGDVVTTDTLIDGAWGDDPPPTADKSLQSHISRIRQRLPDGMIETTDHGYRLHVRPADVDVHRLVHLVEEAQQASTGLDPHFAAELLDEAVELWRGERHSDILPTAPTAPRQIARLEATRELAVSARVEAHLAIGHHEFMIPELERLVNEYPYREQLWSQLMLALYRAGRRHRCTPQLRTIAHRAARGHGHQPVRGAARHGRAHRRRGRTSRSREPAPGVDTADTALVVHRSSELSRALVELLETHRLVTVLGPGGVGKTRIAIHAANRCRERWPDGTFFVELAGADEVDDVVGDLLATLPWIVEGAIGSDPRESLERSLGRRSVLLVFDAAERLADPVGDFVEHLLESAPNVTALVTSRAPLHVPGEHLLDVSPDGTPRSRQHRVAGRRSRPAVLGTPRTCPPVR